MTSASSPGPRRLLMTAPLVKAFTKSVAPILALCMPCDLRHDRGMTLERLRSALWQTPIPTSPPPTDGQLEALGLNLLALALRLEHVDRMSEALTLADSTHMTRSVSIDVNLTVLTP